MTTTPRLGICFIPFWPPEILKGLARAADQAGLDEFWVWEDCFKESGIASAAAALAWTDAIEVRIGLLPAPLRNVGLTAMEIATLDRMFPGRFTAGIGHGVQEWMAQAGGRVLSPMTLLHEYATALRRLLDGERVAVEGTYVRLDDVVLDWPPLTRPGLLIGGAGPKTLALAGELGDGAILTGNLTYDEVEQACRIVSGASAGGGPADVTAGQIAATGPGARSRVDAEIAAWGAQPGEGVGVAGDAGAIAASVLHLAERGATAVCIQPTRDEPDLPGLVRVLGEVKRLIM